MNRIFSFTALSFVACLLMVTVATSTVAQVRKGAVQTVPTMLERVSLKGFDEPSVKPGSTLIAYELAWNPANPEVIAQRLAGALTVILGKSTVDKALDSESLQEVVSGKSSGDWVRLGELPVFARYQAEFDEIRVINDELDVITKTDSDIGIEGAQKIAEEVIAALGEVGVIEPRLYEKAAMQLGYKMVGDGSVDAEIQKPRVIEYRITLRPRLAGFQMVNAGLRLGILSSGQIASLRVGGVTPAGKWDKGELVPNEAYRDRIVRVSTKDLMDRFYRQLPQDAEALIAWSRIMYVIPEGETEAVVEPRLLISYSTRWKQGDQLVSSRRKTLAYSLTNPEEEPIDFDSPTTEHEGSTPQRK